MAGLECMPVCMHTAHVWVILPALYGVLLVHPCIAPSQTVPASSMMLGHTRSCLQGPRYGSRHIPTPTPTDRPATNGLLAVICGAYTTPMQPLPPRMHCWEPATITATNTATHCVPARLVTTTTSQCGTRATHTGHSTLTQVLPHIPCTSVQHVR